MKTVYLIRHAKSSWENDALPDRERPLNERGQRDAPEMARRLAKRGARPDLIVTSPAVRARSTARVIAKGLHYKRRRIVLDERLYPGGADLLLEVIRELDDRHRRVMLFGHNPGLADLAHRLCADIARMPTCAVAEFRFDAPTWARVGAASLARATLDYPKKS